MLGIASLLSILSVNDALSAPKVPYPVGHHGALLIQMMGEALERGRLDGGSMAVVSAMMYYTTAFGQRVIRPSHHIEMVIEGANGVFANSEVPLRIVVLGIQELKLRESADGYKRLDEFLFARSSLAKERVNSSVPHLQAEQDSLIMPRRIKKSF